MNKTLICLTIISVICFLTYQFYAKKNMVVASENLSKSELYAIKINTLQGDFYDFKDLKGKVLLMVNTASHCGFTKQYEGLQAIYEKYQNKGLVVVGIPSNDFGNQEPGSAQEIGSFCKINYGVTFPLLEKVKVKGKNKHPLITFLTESNKKLSGRIMWNFNKFLISKEGKVVSRFNSMVKPTSKKIESAIQKELKVK